MVRQETRNFQPTGSDLKGRLSENRETLAGITSADAKNPEEPAARNNQSPSTPLPWALAAPAGRNLELPQATAQAAEQFSPAGQAHDRAPAKTQAPKKIARHVGPGNYYDARKLRVWVVSLANH